MKLFARPPLRWFLSSPKTTRKRPRRTHLTIELLEDRNVLSAAPIAVNVHGLADSLAVGNTLYFSTAAGELWKTDGTPAGTTLVKDLAPYSHLAWDFAGPRDFADVGGTLFFAYRDPDSGTAELWKSDGTDSGTLLVKDFGAEVDSWVFPAELTAVNGTLFFTTFTPGTGDELWKSDGTAAGTVVVPTGSALPAGIPLTTDLVSFQNELYFTINHYGQTPSLWKTDGTDAGTVLVSDFQPMNYGWAGGLVVVGGSLYGLSTDFAAGRTVLWQCDGTDTTPVKQIDVQWGGFASPTLTAVNGRLFFATHTISGDDLWTSDGTEGGTVLVREFPAHYGSLYQGMTGANGLYYFGATDLESGPTLWQSDGTDGGTVPVLSTAEGHRISSPANEAVVNGKLLFFADKLDGWQPVFSGGLLVDFALVVGYNFTSRDLVLWCVTPDNDTVADPIDLSVLDPKPIDDTPPHVFVIGHPIVVPAPVDMSNVDAPVAEVGAGKLCPSAPAALTDDHNRAATATAGSTSADAGGRDQTGNEMSGIFMLAPATAANASQSAQAAAFAIGGFYAFPSSAWVVPDSFRPSIAAGGSGGKMQGIEFGSCDNGDKGEGDIAVNLQVPRNRETAICQLLCDEIGVGPWSNADLLEIQVPQADYHA